MYGSSDGRRRWLISRRLIPRRWLISLQRTASVTRCPGFSQGGPAQGANGHDVNGLKSKAREKGMVCGRGEEGVCHVGGEQRECGEWATREMGETEEIQFMNKKRRYPFERYDIQQVPTMIDKNLQRSFFIHPARMN